MSDIDILSIDSKTRIMLEKEQTELPEYKQKLVDAKRALNTKTIKLGAKKNLLKTIDFLKSKIKSLEKHEQLNLYIAQTAPYIEKYKQLLKVPLKMNFMGKRSADNKQKTQIIQKYLEIAHPYTGIHSLEYFNDYFTIKTCQHCGNNDNNEFEVEEGNTKICMKCYAEQPRGENVSSYNDVDRVNISSKYMYERKVHFRDCLKQYQGKQNCTIPQIVIDELEEQFKLHHLLVGNETVERAKRFKNITKLHILMFLKEPLGYTKHYENVHLLHYMFTCKKPNDVSHLEDQLMDDFDLLTKQYNLQNIDRKNFINTQYVLFQLLRRHKHPCKTGDFAVLKTIDRKCYHDEICKKLFEQLGWNHTPYY